jgi:hypothetical protein
MIFLIIALLLAFSCSCRAVKDKLSHHYSTSVFSSKEFNPLFWNPNESWKNKWKNGSKAEGEKFLFSSTALVWTTDAWHLFSALELAGIHLALAVALSLVLPINILLIGISIKVIYAIFFNLYYDILLNKRRHKDVN